MKTVGATPHRSPRVERIVHRCIDGLALDLAGLTVYTEAATGPYLYTPVLAAVGGAEQVLAVTRDSATGPRARSRRRRGPRRPPGA